MTDPKRTDSPEEKTTGETSQERLDSTPPPISEGVEETTVSYGFVLTASALMFLGVWAFVQVMSQATREHHQSSQRGIRKATLIQPPPNSTLVALQAAPASVQIGAQKIQEQRKLRDYYKRRAYLGAPPKVPHPVHEKHSTMENCLGCHGKGGYVPKYRAYAPVTPHPTYTNCVQCHVSQNTKTLFKPTAWTKMKPPKLRRTSLPGGPPPIPHTLQLRTNCNACHAGPGSVRELRTPHPDRTNCLQCHVPRRRIQAFHSKYQVPLLGQIKKRTPSPSRTSRPTTRRR